MFRDRVIYHSEVLSAETSATSLYRLARDEKHYHIYIYQGRCKTRGILTSETMAAAMFSGNSLFLSPEKYRLSKSKNEKYVSRNKIRYVHNASSVGNLFTQIGAVRWRSIGLVVCAFVYGRIHPKPIWRCVFTLGYCIAKLILVQKRSVRKAFVSNPTRHGMTYNIGSLQV